MLTCDPQALLLLTRQVFEACGAPTAEAGIVSEHLVENNLRGVDSHGVMRIPQYVQAVRDGVIRPGAAIVLKQETTNTAVVACGWNFGMVGGIRAIQTAVAKAKAHTMGMVVTRCCNHAGRLGAYVEWAALQGMIALGFCSSPRHGHFVAPWGGKEGRLATNPIAFAIPNGDRPPLVSDFSTAQVPEGKIRLYQSQNRSLEDGWIMDATGRPSRSPADFYGPPQGAILPFGGQMGYRGYALGLLVEIMGTTLAGEDSTSERAGNGLAFIVVDPTALIEHGHYCELIESLTSYVKSSEPMDYAKPVLLPGELERQVRLERQNKGVPIDESTWVHIVRTARALGCDTIPVAREMSGKQEGIGL
ncbi:MAG: Ldh family oxidoreductase [Planctomycetes bacterium]|nr:Ldh family oxidoreductase [Planctomycetota bacterium]